MVCRGDPPGRPLFYCTYRLHSLHWSHKIMLVPMLRVYVGDNKAQSAISAVLRTSHEKRGSQIKDNL